MTHVGIAAPPVVGWDIHCHTVFSDGTETPRTLLEQAKSRGLQGVAITDHDTTAGWSDAQRAATWAELPLLRGTEITADDNRISVHMLAFQYDPDNAQIREMFANTRAARLRRTKRMVEHIAEDYPITWHSVQVQARMKACAPPSAGRISPMRWWRPACIEPVPKRSPAW